ncbi:hypothetical protein LINPERHAP2_LOCUS21976, partial [Linum perenne]
NHPAATNRPASTNRPAAVVDARPPHSRRRIAPTAAIDTCPPRPRRRVHPPLHPLGVLTTVQHPLLVCRSISIIATLAAFVVILRRQWNDKSTAGDVNRSIGGTLGTHVNVKVQQ